MTKQVRNNPLTGIVKATTRIEPGELNAVLLSFVLVLALMTSYSVLKPVRDAMAADWGNIGLSITWTVNFGVSLAAITLYGVAPDIRAIQDHGPRNLCSFLPRRSPRCLLFERRFPTPVLVNQGFYVWVSVFSLFNLSVFWSFMTDIYSRSQAKRVFGFIAAGTTVGAIVGPIATATLVDNIGANGLLLVSAALLMTPVFVMPMLRRMNGSASGGDEPTSDGEGQTLGHNPFSGFSILFSDRYMLGIGAFILLYVTINTFVYFELQDLTREYSLEFRAKIWSYIEISTNVLTLVTAAAITGRIVTKFGMPTALALVPGLIVIGILALVAAPTLAVLAVFHVLRRAGNYAITRPSREMLFTVLDRETRFKAKPVIDVVLYRGGDVITAWLFTLLASGMGLGLAQIAWVISGIAAVWAGVAVWLGRQYEVQSGEPGAVDNENNENELHGTA